MKLSDYRRFCKNAEKCELCRLYVPSRKNCLFSISPKAWSDEDIKDVCERIKRRAND